MKTLKDGKLYFIRYKGEDEWTVGKAYFYQETFYFFRVGSECEDKADMFDIGRMLTAPKGEQKQ